MNENQNVRNRNLERPIPGCLGRMVNLFDLNTSLGGNKLLTDKPHYEGSPVFRSQSDVSRTCVIDDQMIVPELAKSPSNRKSNGTPIKMLIAQEMSKEDSPKQNSPNLVAKLMGLDDLPQNPQLNSASCRTNSRRSRSHSGSLDFTHEELNHYKDVFEIWQQSCKTYSDLPQKGRYKESKNDKNDKNMALVREKFMEAKRLSTDEKLRQSKQFQDALEVLNSNKELFLKFLQEPNSLFSQHHNLQTVPPPPPPDSRRITVLKPSKLINGHKLTVSENKNEKKINENMWEKFNSNHNPSQPTRIVVLKPSSVKDIKTVISPPSSLQTSNFDDGFYGDQEDDEPPRGVLKSQNLTHRRDKTLISSVLSNGYIGDESSFSKSEVYYAAGNLSDSEMMSPISRHSWDYINRFGSPYSSSSFSRASYSPESSVCKEAKKRLSERWAMMSLNGNVQEQRHVRRSSSTLGEMLALSDLKKSEENNCHNDGGDVSPKNLVRSKSVPVSGSDLLKVKQDDTKELTKEKSVKSSSFKGKVSSLFFSKSRKCSKQKSNKSNDENQCGNDTTVKMNDPVGEHLPEAGFVVTTGNAVENQDQPSPISVLELQFEDDNEHDPIKYNLIDKSPLIGSIARTLSFEDSVVGPVPVSGKTSTLEEEEEEECLFYVQTLLSAAGIDSGARLNSFLARFHSPESPLDPSLREKYMNLTTVHNSKQRHQRSFQKLVFDLVNEALIRVPNKDVSVVDHVWARVKEWVSGEDRCVWGGGDGGGEDDYTTSTTTTTLAVERVVRKEVVGEIWTERLRLQIDDMKKEIEEKLVEEVVEEFVLELLTGRVILSYTF